MDERGFTLVELLTVILIVGILAAIALPTFLGQTAKAHDATAKADVRNAVTQMEACFTAGQSYSGCPSAAYPLAAGVDVVVQADGKSYRATRTSETGTSFTIRQLATGYARTCTAPGEGGCDALGSW